MTNFGSMVSTAHSLQPQQSPAGSANPLINFDNPNVQKALDNLIQSGPNLLKSIPSSVSQQTSTVQSNYLGQQASFASTLSTQQQQRPQQQSQPRAQGGYGQFQQYPQQGAGRGAGGYGNQQRPYLGNRAPQQGVRPRY